MPNKIRFILNPLSNHSRSLEIASTLQKRTVSPQALWAMTEGPQHATELARQAGADGADLVVACGGDGTVHEVINGLMLLPEKKRPALGILPLGSGNDFAHILGVPADPAAALEACLKGHPRVLDMGVVRDGTGRQEFFNNTIGIGFDAVVTIHTQEITSVHGFLMYLLATLQTILRNFDPMDLQVQTETESWEQATIMLTLGNGPREGGGFLVTPEAKLDDGLLHYVAVRKISRLAMLRLVPEFMKGTHGRFKPVRMGICRRMSISSRGPMYVHTDGEIFAGFGTDVRTLTVELLPSALRFMEAG